MGVLCREKILADPAQIFLALLRKRYTGANARVHKSIVADNDMVFEASDKVGAYVEGRCLENGLIIRAIGDNLAFCPPLITTDAEIDEIFDITQKSLDKAETWVQDQGLRDS